MFVLRPLAQRPIALLWTGQVLAAIGAEFYMVGIIWLAVGLIGRDAGYVAALQAGALLLGSLLGGILTDRWRHSSTMIAVDLLRAGLMFILSLASLTHAMNLPLLAVVAGCVALATSAFDPALQATLPVLAPDPALRHAANGLFDATKRTARILGPSLIALVNGILPIGQFFTLTAVTFLLSAVAVFAVAAQLPACPRHQTTKGVAAVKDGVFGGIHAVRGHTVMIYGLVANLIGNAAWAGGMLLGMVLFLRETHADPLTTYSLMMMAYGIGNLGTNLILANFKPSRPALWLVVSKLVFGLGVLFLPLAPDRVWLMLLAAFAATNGPFENLAMLHLMQSDFPPWQLAQVYRLQMSAVVLGLLLAYLAAPTLFAWFGSAPVIMAAGAATLLTGCVGIFLFRFVPSPSGSSRSQASAPSRPRSSLPKSGSI